MTSGQDQGIGGIRHPKHEVAAGMHKSQRYEIGPHGRSAQESETPSSMWARLVARFRRA